jgi:hypothetical protein
MREEREAIMLTLIALVTFIVVPSITILSLLSLKGQEITLLAAYSWEKEHSVDVDLSGIEAERALDSFTLVVEDLSQVGFVVNAMSCLPSSGRTLLVLEEVNEAANLPPWELA